MRRMSRLCFALAQRGAERAARFGGIAALLDGFGDVRRELFVDLAVEAVARGRHWRCVTTATYQAILRTRLTAEVTACQRDSSAASCFLPAAVSS